MLERDDEDEKVKHNNASLPTLQYFHFTTHEYTAKEIKTEMNNVLY